MKKALFILLATFSFSQGSFAKIASTASCDTLWNGLTKNDAGQAMSFAYTKNTKLKIMERPSAKWLNKEDWLKVCENNKKLGH